MECFRMLTIPVIGKNCVLEKGELLGGAGKRAAVITGKFSAVASGALDDIRAVLEKFDISYTVIAKAENNPHLENVAVIAKEAKEAGADHIIGIGGGSAMDAAKAAAVLCTNDISPDMLFKDSIKADPLPVYAIPTTAGTGSEVTPYSVLTVKGKETKLSFGDNRMFPRVAFLDHRYTRTMGRATTVDTAFDAFSHAFEGYISKRATRTAGILAIESMKIFFASLPELYGECISEKVREELLYASMLAGMVISQTGTTALHSMGYALTYNKGIPHGRANGLLFCAYYMELMKENRRKLEELTKKLGLGEVEEPMEKIKKLFPEKLDLGMEEKEKYVEDTLKQKSLAYTPAKLDHDTILRIFENKGK
jgi:alcohol dehydrogenase class IV